MKSIGKKGMFITSTAIVLITAVVVSVSAFAGNLTVEDSSKDIQMNTVEIWNRWATEEDILSEYEKLCGVSVLSDEQKEYAGVYFNEDGKAVINFKLTDDSVSTASVNTETQPMTVSDGINAIIVRYVKYSQAELEEIRNKIEEFAPNVGEYRMKEMSISYKLNQIKIGVGSEVDIADFTEKLLEKLSLSDSYSNMFNVYVCESNWFVNDEDNFDSNSSNSKETINAVAEKKINGCSELYFTSDDGETRRFSVAAKYVSDEYGEGFISTGHSLFDVGDYIKCNGDTVGQVMEKHFDGYDDSSFIAFYNQYSWYGAITNKAEQFQRGKVPNEGATVKLRGYLANEYIEANVTDNSKNIYGSSDGTVWYDMIEVDHKVSHGDSGGACIYGSIDTGRTSLIVGVISQSDDLRTLIVKADNVHEY